LGHSQDLLCDEAFEFAESLPLEKTSSAIATLAMSAKIRVPTAT
jgi:hypothetical protein